MKTAHIKLKSDNFNGVHPDCREYTNRRWFSSLLEDLQELVIANRGPNCGAKHKRLGNLLAPWADYRSTVASLKKDIRNLLLRKYQPLADIDAEIKMRKETMTMISSCDIGYYTIMTGGYYTLVCKNRAFDRAFEKETKMVGCGKKMEEYVPSGFDYKKITVKCGNTSPSGDPWLCDDCAERYAGTDWRREAELNGEAWGEDDY